MARYVQGGIDCHFFKRFSDLLRQVEALFTRVQSLLPLYRYKGGLDGCNKDPTLKLTYLGAAKT